MSGIRGYRSDLLASVFDARGERDNVRGERGGSGKDANQGESDEEQGNDVWSSGTLRNLVRGRWHHFEGELDKRARFRTPDETARRAQAKFEQILIRRLRHAKPKEQDSTPTRKLPVKKMRALLRREEKWQPSKVPPTPLLSSIVPSVVPTVITSSSTCSTPIH